MRKRLFAFCLLFTIVCSVCQTPALADELKTLTGLAEEGASNESRGLEDAAWREGPTLSTPRICAGIVAVGNKIYVMGGWTASGYVLTNALEIYDVDTEEWVRGADMPAPKEASGYVLINVQPGSSAVMAIML